MKIAIVLIVSLSLVACDGRAPKARRKTANPKVKANPKVNVPNVQQQGATSLTKEQAAIKQLEEYINKKVHKQDDLWIRLENIKDEGVLSQDRLLSYALLELGKFNGKLRELAKLILRELKVLNAINLLLEYLTKINDQGAFIIDPQGRIILGLLNNFYVEEVLSGKELREYNELWDGKIINKDPYELASAVLNNLKTNNQGGDAKDQEAQVITADAGLIQEAIEQLRKYQEQNWPELVDIDGVELFKMLDKFILLGVLSDKEVKDFEESFREVTDDPGMLASDVIIHLREKRDQKREDISFPVYPEIDIPPQRQCLSLKAIERVKECRTRGGGTPDPAELFRLLAEFQKEGVFCMCELRRLHLKFHGNKDPDDFADEIIHTLMGPRYLKCCETDGFEALNVTNTTVAAGLNKDEEAIKGLKKYIKKIEINGAKKYDPDGKKLFNRLNDLAFKGVLSPTEMMDYAILENSTFLGNPKGLAGKVLNDIQVAVAVDQLNEYMKKNWPVVFDRKGDQLWDLLEDYKAQGFLHQPTYDHYGKLWNGRVINKDPYSLATYVAVDIQDRYGNVNGNAAGNGNANPTKIPHGKV